MGSDRALGLCAVLVLSKTTEKPLDRMVAASDQSGVSKSGAWFAGVLFAFSAVSYRGASLQLGRTGGQRFAPGSRWPSVVSHSDPVHADLAEPGARKGEIARVWQPQGGLQIWVGHDQPGLGSFCWFWAFTLQNAAYVKALGQVELLLSILASLLFFKEKISLREVAGMGLLVLSILALGLAL